MKVLLDRNGDATLPTGYQLLQTEIDFLRCVGVDTSLALFVRGDVLCEWAERFCRARAIPFQNLRSPIQELMTACSGLNRQQAEEIYRLLDRTFEEFSSPIAVQDILGKLYPQRMWRDAPSWEHGATWLSWLTTEAFPDAVEPFLASATDQWRLQSSGQEALLYTVFDKDGATQLLLQWLGVIESKARFDGPFPVAIPSTITERLRSDWKKEIVSTSGEGIRHLLARRMPGQLKSLAAAIAADYFKKHPATFTSLHLREMLPYLDAKQQNELRSLVIPDLPGDMPTTPGDVLNWYRYRYLPYRMWQEKHGQEEALEVVGIAAQQFIRWYLDEYPKGLLGGQLKPHLSFDYSMRLANSGERFATLVVVLDGLQVNDGEYVLQRLKSGTERLTVAQEILAFTALPTVTEFCKDALLKGIAPVHAPDHQPLGKVLAESRSPIDILQTASPGQLYLWRVQEPDSTYHSRNGHQMLKQDIQSRLDGITQKIVDVVNGVNADVPLRIIVTTDHGRLLAESQRSLPVPPEMKAHGRAAWGISNRTFPASGYLIEDDIVFLHKDRFGLPSDAAVAVTEDMFLTNDDRRGKELYPHGGLYPEEVIVPWWVFLRDVGDPELIIHLSGRGRAGASETAELRVQSLSEIEVKIVTFHLSFFGGRRIETSQNLVCPVLYASQFPVEIDRWPTKQELQEIFCEVEVQLAGGRRIDFAVTVTLESEEMYTRDQSLLEGLDI